MERIPRLPTSDDWESVRPVYVVWELTLACDQRCGHCGSRAGRRRPDELSLAECRSVVAQLAALGTREITLIGGEAYLRPDWIEILRCITEHGMLCTLQTGGRGLTAERLDAAVAAGLSSVGVSIDGPAAIHDALRGVAGSHAAAFSALALCRARGLPVTVNTTLTPAALPHLEALFEPLVDAGVATWQVGINVAMGRAADAPDGLLQPSDLLDLMPRLADLARRGAARGLLLMPGNTVGYFGPYESLLRHANIARLHWTGCNAGRNSMGIESDGTVKACPSLPREHYTAGSVREQAIADLWRNSAGARLLRTRTVEDLWGFCRTCEHASDCLAGCAWVAHSFLGRPGNNPYCHHRALVLSQQGLRERVERRKAPPGNPFDLGEFVLYLEPIEGEGDAKAQLAPSWSPPDLGERGERPVPRRLALCPACQHYSPPETGLCTACGNDLALASFERADQLRSAHRALTRLRVLMEQSELAPTST